MKGFTLIEVLVALGVFALLAGTGTALLAQLASGQTAVTRRGEQLMALQRLHAVLKADVAQAVPRLTRDARGDHQLAHCGAAAEGEPLLSFVRMGHDNPDRLAQSEARAVRYVLRDGALVRQSKPGLDGGDWGPDDRLLVDVRSVRIACLVNGVWRDRHVVTDQQPWPRAIRLSLERGSGDRLDMTLLGQGLL